MSTEPQTSARRSAVAERAYREGRRDADVDSALHSHEKRLNAINGSIDRFERRLAGMERTMATSDAIEEALLKVAERTGTKRFTRIQSLGIIVLGLTAVGGFVLSIIAALGHA